MNLTHKTLLITGASGGIGEWLVQYALAAGAKVIATARNVETLRPLQSDVCMLVAADLTDTESRKEVIDCAVEHSVDIVINNAGANQLSLLDCCDAQTVESLLSINLIAPILLTQELLPFLKTRPQACIVNVGSILGSIGMPGQTLYCTSKFGLRGFSQSLRRELADTKVAVIYFAPRATATTMNSDRVTEMNSRLKNAVDDPSDVAKKLIQILQRNRAYDHYLGWSERVFVRLNTIFPKIVDRALFKQLNVIKFYAKES